MKMNPHLVGTVTIRKITYLLYLKRHNEYCQLKVIIGENTEGKSVIEWKKYMPYKKTVPIGKEQILYWWPYSLYLMICINLKWYQSIPSNKPHIILLFCAISFLSQFLQSSIRSTKSRILSSYLPTAVERISRLRQK